MPQESGAPATVQSEELWKSDCIVVVGRFRPWTRSGLVPRHFEQKWGNLIWRQGWICTKRAGWGPCGWWFSLPMCAGGQGVLHDEDDTGRRWGANSSFPVCEHRAQGGSPMGTSWAPVRDAHQPYRWPSISLNPAGLLNTALPGLLPSPLRFMMDLTFRDPGLWGRRNLWDAVDPSAPASPSKLTGPGSHLFNFLPPKELTI